MAEGIGTGTGARCDRRFRTAPWRSRVTAKLALAGTCLLGLVGMQVAASSLPASAKTPKPLPYAAIVNSPSGTGYWLVQTDGTVTPAGTAPALTNTNCDPTFAAPAIGAVATPDGLGLWEVNAGGAVACLGDAVFYGSMGAYHLNHPMVGIAATPDGLGYRFVSTDGGVFCFGDAVFLGSEGGTTLPKPIVSIAATPANGYWMVGGSGIVYPFGDAAAHGNGPRGSHIVAMAGTHDGNGYWLLDKNGAVRNFGDAAALGSTTVPAGQRMVSLASTPSGNGYYELGLHGVVSPQGAAGPALRTGSTSGPAVAVGDVLTGFFSANSAEFGTCTGLLSATVQGNSVAHGAVTLALHSTAGCAGSQQSFTFGTSPDVTILSGTSVVAYGSSVSVTTGAFTADTSGFGSLLCSGLSGAWLNDQSAALVSGDIGPVAVSFHLGSLSDSSVSGSPLVYVS